MDLVETREQRYAREFGSCDFRDPKEPSPLDNLQTPDLRAERGFCALAG
jgi:hypothetical protein